MTNSLTPIAIHDAYILIKPYVRTTPLLTCKTLNAIASTPQSPGAANPTFRFFFKCENFQRVGAFKARGAFHALLRLIEAEGEQALRERGVVTHSSGLFLLRFKLLVYFAMIMTIALFE